MKSIGSTSGRSPFSIRHLQTAGVIFAVLTLAAASNAQVNSTGTISGRVTDAQDRVVPGATVEIVEQLTNVTNKFFTNGSGYYSAGFLKPGSYSVQVGAAGFETALRTGLTLQTQQTLSQDFVLTVGQVTSTVTVIGGAPLLNTESGELGNVVAAETVVQLRLNGGNFAQLALVGPRGNSWIRYDLFTTPIDRKDRQSNFVPDGGVIAPAPGGTGTAVIGSQGGYSRGSCRLASLAHRLGDKTVIRSAYGLYFFNEQGTGPSARLFLNYPLGQTFSVSYASTAACLSTSTGVPLAPSATNVPIVVYMPLRSPTPYVHQWNLRGASSHVLGRRSRLVRGFEGHASGDCVE